ncbi:MAG: AMP-binding protein [Planctomycetota bacterium]
MTHPYDWLVEHLRTDPTRQRISYLDDGDVWRHLSGRAIMDAATRLSADLRERAGAGARVLLAYPPGLDFSIGLLGCIHAGLIPVPVQPPKPRRSESRFGQVASNADAKLALTTRRLADSLHEQVRTSLDWIGVEPVTADPSRDLENQSAAKPPLEPRHHRRDDDLVFLQYTSGSTRSPKGVMVGLGNLQANLDVISRGFQVDRIAPMQRVVCGWLPMYHDMGLVGILLAALRMDAHAVTLSANRFLQQPAIWLKAISDYSARVTIAPTFGFHWATRRAEPDEVRGLDLSCLDVTACGAEPISAKVLDEFAERFSEIGFRGETFYPCYGLAESTLMVTGHDRGDGDDAILPPKRREFRRAAEFSDRDTAADVAVSSGVVRPPTALQIVDPESARPLDDGQVGEIWTASPSVALGYWNNESDTKTVFGATLPGDSRRYLRTGDLGMIHQGQLYVTGRIRELIIIGGANHFPQDIEQAVSEAVGTRVDGLPLVAVATPSAEGETEGLAIIQEVPRQFATREFTTAPNNGSPVDLGNIDGPKSVAQQNAAAQLVRDIRLAVAKSNELATQVVHLVRVASLPRTSSGKLRRVEAARMLAEGSLKTLHSWRQPTGFDERVFRVIPKRFLDAREGRPDTQRIAAFIETCLIDYLFEHADAPEHCDANTALADWGLDSLRAVELSRQLECWLGRRLSPVLAWSHPSPKRLSEHLAGLIAGEEHADAPESGIDGDDLASGDDLPPGELDRLLDELEQMDDAEAAEMLKRLQQND